MKDSIKAGMLQINKQNEKIITRILSDAVTFERLAKKVNGIIDCFKPSEYTGWDAEERYNGCGNAIDLIKTFVPVESQNEEAFYIALCEVFWDYVKVSDSLTSDEVAVNVYRCWKTSLSFESL